MTSAATPNLNVWFGTRGISIFHSTLDVTTGELTIPTAAADTSSPGFLCINRSQSLLYCLGQPGSNEGVSVYRIVGQSLKLLNSRESELGGKGTHLSLSRDERTLLVAHYGGSRITSFSLEEDGRILDPVSCIEHQGKSIHPERQTAAHPHWIGQTLDAPYVLVPDLGLDQIVVYSLNEGTHELSKHGIGEVAAGQGPRHLVFHPNAKWAYVMNELGLTVTHIELDAQTGVLTNLQTVEALPQSEVKDVLTTGSEIRIHPNGRFVYAGIRGHDVIVVFSVDDENGDLTLVEREPIRGSWVRNFAIDPSGKWLLAAGDESNTISVFRIDTHSGQLTFTRHIINVPSCICVAFSQAIQ